MKKKVVGVLIVIVILVGLIIFASIYKFEDSHIVRKFYKLMVKIKF